MSDTSHDRSDTRLLLGVAGAVVAGALGIAYLAGLASEDAPASTARATTTPAAAAVRHDPVRPVAAVQPAVTTAAADAARRAEAEFVGPTIEAGADPVAVGLTAWREREYPLAAAAFEAAVAGRPDDPWLHYMLGLSRFRTDDLAGADEALERARSLRPDDVKTLVNLARVRNEAGEFDRALEAATHAVDVAPDRAESHFLLGRTLRNLGRPIEAEAALRASLELDPDGAWARNLLGLVLIEGNRSDEAVGHLEAAAGALPDVAFVRNNLGMALELERRFDEAATAYTAAVGLDPRHERAATNLARLEAVRGVEPAATEVEGIVIADDGAGDGGEDATVDPVVAESDATTVAAATEPGR